MLLCTIDLILAAQASNFYHGFYNALGIFSPKIDADSAVSNFTTSKNVICSLNACQHFWH